MSLWDMVEEAVEGWSGKEHDWKGKDRDLTGRGALSAAVIYQTRGSDGQAEV